VRLQILWEDVGDLVQGFGLRLPVEQQLAPQCDGGHTNDAGQDEAWGGIEGLLLLMGLSRGLVFSKGVFEGFEGRLGSLCESGSIVWRAVGWGGAGWGGVRGVAHCTGDCLHSALHW
jgi:hypothetical protein